MVDTGARTRVAAGPSAGMHARRQPPAPDPVAGDNSPFRSGKHMAELAHSEVQLSRNAPDASLPRKPFVAPAVEHLGRLEANTLLTAVIP
jgi:hypothetical protein